jgi:hypothetical protein
MAKKKPKTDNQEERISENDLMFLKLALPRGIVRGSTHLRINECFRTYVVAFSYPSHIEDLLIARLQDLDGVIITLDITPTPKHAAMQNVSLSMQELRAREQNDQRDAEALQDSYDYSDLQELHGVISRANEHIISHTLRFLVTGDSEAQLKENVKNVQDALKIYGIESYVPENELLMEYKTSTLPADTVKKPLPLYSTLSRQFPFRYESHYDPRGTYFGQTGSGGQVFLDPTLNDQTQQRLSYDLVLCGVKGSGKSATMKSMLQDILCCGHRAIVLDEEGEFTAMVKKLGGALISPFDKTGRINILDFPRESFAPADGDESATMSAYASGISRVETFFRQLVPSMSILESDALKSVLHRLYCRFGVTENGSLADISADTMPCISDALEEIQVTLQDPTLTENRKMILENLESYVRSVSAQEGFGALFDCKSSIDIRKESFVVVDLSLLSQMEPRIYNAMLYSVLSLAWQEVYANREYNRRLTDNDPHRHLVIGITEAHRYLNTNNHAGLEFIEKLVRRARKYDAGLWFDSQRARDFMPTGVTEGTEKIKTIFELVQYKAVLKQDEASVEVLQELFPQFTASELASAVSFSPGQMLLSLGNGVKLRLQKHIPSEDLSYFGGGREHE